MVGNKQLYKHWDKPSLERQVLDIKQQFEKNIVENSPAETLIIPTEIVVEKVLPEPVEQVIITKPRKPTRKKDSKILKNNKNKLKNT